MNGFRRSTIAATLAAAICLAIGFLTPAVAIADGEIYQLHFQVEPRPNDGTAKVVLTVKQAAHYLREIRFGNARLDTASIRADGNLDVSDDVTVWQVPVNGGEIRWVANVEHRRNDNGFDAYLTKHWGIFRAEDVIPRATTRTLRGSSSRTTLSFELPAKWSVITEYKKDGDQFRVAKSDRRYDEPSGWIAVGDLGIRRENIAGVKVAVAAPKGHDMRRMDILALLNWTLPELVRIVPDPPERLTIIGADDPMWRGGLSAPASIYLHADRPLISENATSTLVHEVMHTALRLNVAQNYDWITEGLAEFYSVELLKRGGAISMSRYNTALKDLASRGQRARKHLCGRRSSGRTTALAATVFVNLDAEIRKSSGGKSSLDDLVARLQTSPGRLTVDSLRRFTEELIGAPSKVLSGDNVKSCSVPGSS